MATYDNFRSKKQLTQEDVTDIAKRSENVRDILEKLYKNKTIEMLPRDMTLLYENLETIYNKVYLSKLLPRTDILKLNQIVTRKGTIEPPPQEKIETVKNIINKIEIEISKLKSVNKQQSKEHNIQSY